METETIVSLILVVRNERDYIDRSLNSLLEQSYPKRLTEVVLVDGMSTDGTREFIEDKARELSEAGINIKFFNNPGQILSAGWNIAIKNSSGAIVCRIDGHSTIGLNYIETGVRELMRRKEQKVIAIGGWLTNVGEGIAGRAISYMSSSRFAVGNTPNRFAPKEPAFTDIVCYGLYWKHAVEEIGYFDENLVRNQDVEFLSRAKRAGYRIMTHPGMKAIYFVRNTVGRLLKKAFSDGLWVVLSKSSYLRHKIPLFFLIYLIALACFSAAQFSGHEVAWKVQGAVSFPFLVYIIMGFIFALKDGRSIYIVLMMPLFLLYHISYGAGSLCGVVKRTFDPARI